MSLPDGDEFVFEQAIGESREYKPLDAAPTKSDLNEPGSSDALANDVKQ